MSRFAPVVFALLCFASSRWLVLANPPSIGSDVHEHFWKLAVSHVDYGQTPYTSALPVEFPPLAWWQLRAVRELSGGPLDGSRDPIRLQALRDQYTVVFRRVMCVADAIAVLVFLAIVRRRRPAALALSLLVYTAATTLLGNVLYDRFDAGVLLLLLCWAYCWLRATGEHDPPLPWLVGAYGAVGLGVAYKVVPVLVLPFLLIADWRSKGRRRRLGTAAIALGVTLALPFAIQYVFSGPGTFYFMTYQGERGIEVGSTFATVMAIASLAGPPTALAITHGATDLTGPLTPAMKMTSSLALVALTGGLLIWLMRRPRREAHLAAYRAACLAVVAAVAVSNVFSPQYLIWALPLVLLIGLEFLGTGTRAHLVTAAVVLGIAALTTWVFPYHFYYFGDHTPLGLVPMDGRPLPPSPWPFIVLGLRNVIYAGLAGWLGYRLMVRPGRAALS